MEHEVYLNTNKDIFYINGINYKEVFFSLKNDVNVKMETLIMLDSNRNYSSIFCLKTKEYNENLVALKKECTGGEVVEIIDGAEEMVYEYHALLNDIAKIDSVVSNSFILTTKNIDEFVNDNFNSDVIKQLLFIASTKPDLLLNIKDGLVVNESEKIKESFEDYIFKVVSAKLSNELEQE
jgi:hypothetical protein